MTEFRPNGLPLLIGSLPLKNHGQATDLVLQYTPEIPLWVQLPCYPEESMIPQFLPGLPGIAETGEKVFVNTQTETFEAQLLQFYEEYMAVAEGSADIEHSRFILTGATAKGFFTFIERIRTISPGPYALKGQTTGPFTFCTGIKAENGQAIFYNEQLRDAAVKLLAVKAAWQTRQLKAFGKPVIIFIDEPALAGFGSSEFISIAAPEVSACLEEVIEAIHAEGGLAGVHVCANTDWSLLLDSSLDIINFDAYGYFDRLILYKQKLGDFLSAGKLLAWGIVPTLKPSDIDRETAAALAQRWEEQAASIESLGIERSRLISQIFITPSCGTGSLDLQHSIRVLDLTRKVSDIVRKGQ